MSVTKPKKKRRRLIVRLDQFSKLILAYIAILFGVVVTCGLFKDVYFMFVDPQYMDWASLYMCLGGAFTGAVGSYLIKSAMEKNRTGKDTDAEGITVDTGGAPPEGTYDVPEVP